MKFEIPEQTLLDTEGSGYSHILALDEVGKGSKSSDHFEDIM